MPRNFWSKPITDLDRPRGFQEVEAPRFQDNQHMKVVRLSALRTGSLYHPRKYSWYSFLLEPESTPGATVRPEGLCQWKIPIAPSGIEPTTFRLVALYLNHLRYDMPPKNLLTQFEMAPNIYSLYFLKRENKYWCWLIIHYFASFNFPPI